MDDAPNPVQRFSTESIAPAARFEYWADVVSRSLLPLKVQTADVSSFAASVSQADLGTLQVIHTQGSAHHSWRTQRDIERLEDRNYHLLVSRTSPWALAHRGQKYLVAGDLVLHDSQYEYRIDIEKDYDIVNVKLPAPWLRTWVADPDDLVGRHIVNTSSWGQVLSRVVSSLLPDFVAAAPLPASVLTDHIGTLLALVCGNLGSAQPAHRRLAQKILQRIRERCTEPSLTGIEIANSLSIEPQSLHAALASTGRSFASELLHLRVVAAVSLLRAQPLRGLKIDEVARRTGFSDVKHFRRVIRSRLGVTPETVRGQTVCRSDSITWEKDPTID